MLPTTVMYYAIMNAFSQYNIPGVTKNGGWSLPAMISSTSKNGFSPYTKVYNVIPRDHISNSGPK